MATPKPTRESIEQKLSDHLDELKFLLEPIQSLMRSAYRSRFRRNNYLIPPTSILKEKIRYRIMFTGALKEMTEITKSRLEKLRSDVSRLVDDELTLSAAELYLNYETDGFWKIKKGAILLICNFDEELNRIFEGSGGEEGVKMAREMDALIAERIWISIDLQGAPSGEKGVCLYDSALNRFFEWLHWTLKEFRKLALERHVPEFKVLQYIGLEEIRTGPAWPNGPTWLSGEEIRGLLDEWKIPWREQCLSP